MMEKKYLFFRDSHKTFPHTITVQMSEQSATPEPQAPAEKTTVKEKTNNKRTSTKRKRPDITAPASPAPDETPAVEEESATEPAEKRAVIENTKPAPTMFYSMDFTTPVMVIAASANEAYLALMKQARNINKDFTESLVPTVYAYDPAVNLFDLFDQRSWVLSPHSQGSSEADE